MQNNPILFATESIRHIVRVRKMKINNITSSMKPEKQYGSCKRKESGLQPQQSLQGLQNVQSMQSIQKAQSQKAAQALTPLTQWHDNYEVMEMFHISQRTLQTLRSNGKLPFAKMGGRCYYKESDLQRLLEDSYRDSRIKPMPTLAKKTSAMDNKEEKGGKPCL